jgi:hypothetical protein
MNVNGDRNKNHNKNTKIPLRGGRYDSLPYAIQTATDWFQSLGIGYESVKRLTINAPTHPNLKNMRPKNQREIIDHDKIALKNTIENNVATPTMFGSVGTLLILNDKTSVEALLSLVTGDDPHPGGASVEGKLRKIASDGMFIVITATGNISAVGKIREYVNNLGMGFSDPKKDSNGEINAILGSCSLTSSVISELRSYVGDNYEILLPVIRSISQDSSREQKSMTFEDILMRIPNPPGEIQPWSVREDKESGVKSREGLDELCARGDVDGAVQLFNRIMKGGKLPIIYSSWFLRRMINLSIMLILMDDGYSQEDAAHAVGSGGPGYTKGRPDPFNGLGGWSDNHLVAIATNGDTWHGRAGEGKTPGRDDLIWLILELNADNAAIHGVSNGHAVSGNDLGDGSNDNSNTIMVDMIVKSALIFSGVHREDIDVDLEVVL